MLQDILAFSDKAVGKAGEIHWQHPAFEDRPDQQGLNASDRGLI